MKLKLFFFKKKESNSLPKNEGDSLKNKKKKRIVLFLGLTALLVFLVLVWFFAIQPALALRASLQKGQALISQTRQSLAEKNLPLLEAKAAEGSLLLSELNQPLKKMAWIKIIPVANQYFANVENLLGAAEKLANSGRLAVRAIAPYADILGFKTEASNEPADKVEGEGQGKAQDRIKFLMETGPELAKNIEVINQDLTEALALLKKINPDYLPESFQGRPIRNYVITLKDLLDANLSLIGGLKPALKELPFFLGQDETRTYLVIFQNDGEIRPTGGFLTAYAILEVKNGQVTPVLSEDIYDLDARFRRRIEAPRPIADYLPKVYYWNLRDMNLSPDFITSMRTFYQHYQTVPGAAEIDGILTVDTKFLTLLLEVLGPVGIAGWGDFSAEPYPACEGCPQVVYRLESIITRPRGTLVTNRKAVIGPLMHSILLHMTNSPAERIPHLFRAIITGIRQKNVLFYALAEDKQESIEGLDISGRIKDFPQGDYFHLNDTNFAGAKSNFFIEQRVDKKFSVAKDGTITKEVRIRYSNPAAASDCNLETGGLCLNGLYRNWFRIYVPKGSQLIEMRGSEVDPLVYEELNKTVFEGFFGNQFPLFPAGGTSIVNLTYQLPFKYDPNQPFSLLIQKQPGAKNHPYRVCWDSNDCREFKLDSDKILEW